MSLDAHIPLGALRAFEASARHLSFSKAAEELFVTQAAVSHQIRRLEEFLGTRLFKRLNRAVLLTDEGQALLPAVHTAFVEIEQAVHQVKGGFDNKRLTISTLPSFASSWLVPRLGSFMEQNPDIDFRLAPSNNLTDFNRDDVDAVVRYGGGNYADLHVEWLFDEDRFPVCSPVLQTRLGPLEQLHDLTRCQLLHDDNHTEWRNWLRLAGADAQLAELADRGPVFTDASMLVQAAVAGQGVALARGKLAQQEIRGGRLVRLFESVTDKGMAYYLVYPPQHHSRPSVQAFRAWLLEQRDI